MTNLKAMMDKIEVILNKQEIPIKPQKVDITFTEMKNVLQALREAVEVAKMYCSQGDRLKQGKIFYEDAGETDETKKES